MDDRSLVTRTPSQIGSSRDEGDPFLIMQRRMNRLFNEFMNETLDHQPFGDFYEAFIPRVDIIEDENEVRVKADLPGMEEKDIDISLNRDVLTIRGEKRSNREEESWQFHRVERSFGTFERQIPLGVEIDTDKVSAEYKQGVLIVILPKLAESAVKTRKIEVKKK
jgi:HSP20 family protein